jgi:hypothetical protein
MRASQLTARERVAADRVVDDIGTPPVSQSAHAVADGFGSVIDQLVGTPRAGYLQFFDAARRGDDARAHGLADLDRGQPDPACSAEHKQRLARLRAHLCLLHDSLAPGNLMTVTAGGRWDMVAGPFVASVQ